MNIIDITAKEIVLSDGTKVKVDADDHAWLSKFKWYRSNVYAERTSWDRKTKKSIKIKMSREIIGAAKGQLVDHKNGDTFDNRKENLRVCSVAENGRNRGKNKNNTSGFKGVTWHDQRRKWVAQIKVNGQHKHIGLFKTKKAASDAYQKAAKQFFGEYANH